MNSIQTDFQASKRLLTGGTRLENGPSGSRASKRILTGGSIAIMCSALSTRFMTAGPDGVRDPIPNRPAASRATGFNGLLRIVGSTDRHFIQLLHPGIDARLRW